jgi:hypothetical protein
MAVRAQNAERAAEDFLTEVVASLDLQLNSHLRFVQCVASVFLGNHILCCELIFHHP